MADLTRGVIAGFVAGIVCGVISAFYEMIYMMIVWGTTIDLWGVIFFGMSAIIRTSLVGLVFGLVYAAAYNFLPGSTSMKKGMTFSVIFWLIYYVIPGGVPFALIQGYLRDWVALVVNSVIVGFIFSLIWGSTLGWAWDRVGGQPAA